MVPDYFDADLGNLIGGHTGWIPISQKSGGVGAVNEVHRDPQLPVALAAVVNANDGWMPELRC